LARVSRDGAVVVGSGGSWCLLPVEDPSVARAKQAIAAESRSLKKALPVFFIANLPCSQSLARIEHALHGGKLLTLSRESAVRQQGSKTFHKAAAARPRIARDRLVFYGAVRQNSTLFDASQRQYVDRGWPDTLSAGRPIGGPGPLKEFYGWGIGSPCRCDKVAGVWHRAALTR
jgi:hypothetical protein